MRELLRSPNHSRARGLGRLGLAWIHFFLIHGPGDVAEIPLSELPLSDELSGVVLDCYALDDDGRRLYDSIFLSRSKGVAKSELAQEVGLFDTMGPSRFGGWAVGPKVFDWGISKGEVFEWMDFRYEYLPNEPMGKPITFPFWRIMATEEGQTGNIYDGVYLNLTEGPLKEAFRAPDDVGLTRVFLPQGGEIRPSTASGASKDGGRETHASYDETHLYTTPETRRMYDTVRRNLRKRKAAEPWSFETSTMYEIGRDSIAERSHALAKEMKAKPGRPRRFLFDHRQAPEDVNLTEDAAVVAALREAYGDATYMDFDGLLSQFHDPRNALEDNIRYFFNLAIASAAKAFSLERWRQLEHAPVVVDEATGETRPYRVAKGALIVLGFDGSRRRDSTALVGTEVATGFQWLLGLWERPPNVDDWWVPEDQVDAVVEEAFSTFNVWRMYCDPPWWEAALARWAGRYGEKRVVEWYTNRLQQMGQCIRAYRSAMTAGDISHDGDPRFAAAVGNAVKQVLHFYDEDGTPLFVISKDRSDSPLKIDAAVAGALSNKARNDAIATGALEEKKPAFSLYVPGGDG